MAWTTFLIASDSPSARRIAACASPSARRISAVFAPSAVRMAACFSPSAVRIAARRSRSARICFSIDSWTLWGGSMALISTRLTRIPHLPVASSSTPRSCALMLSREVRVSSRSMDPMTLRSVVTVSCSMPVR